MFGSIPLVWRMSDPSSEGPIQGRGAVANPTGRFDAQTREAFDDGWGPDEDLLPLRTQVAEDTARSVINHNDSPDTPLDRTINPYRGCEHGCAYCFARPTHAWLGLSPGLDFETRLFAKSDAPGLLEAELRRPGYRCKPILLGANTDAYQPIEQERRITRGILEVLAAFRHPFAVATKSSLILRDLDILAPMAAQGLVAAAVSVTTLDRALARRLEPRAAAPAKRIEVIRRLAEAGVPTGVLAAPMIPGLTDHEMEAIVAAGAAAGARTAGTILLRLPFELAGLFPKWLKANVPDRAERVLNRLREARGGKLYDSHYGERMTGTGPHAELLAQRFRVACRRVELDPRDDEHRELTTDLFRRPLAVGNQMSLF